MELEQLVGRTYDKSQTLSRTSQTEPTINGKCLSKENYFH